MQAICSAQHLFCVWRLAEACWITVQLPTLRNRNIAAVEPGVGLQPSLALAL
jgi:hypothetical protein